MKKKLNLNVFYLKVLQAYLVSMTENNNNEKRQRTIVSRVV
jgi:hypothetical protein